MAFWSAVGRNVTQFLTNKRWRLQASEYTLASRWVLIERDSWRLRFRIFLQRWFQSRRIDGSTD